MIVTYLRSSSYGSWDFCQQKYFLNYTLGLPDVSNKKADKGNIVHKAMEILALRKVAEQNKEDKVSDEAFGEVDTKIIDPSFACSKAWQHCTSHFTHHDWTTEDFEDCSKMVDKAITYGDGMFNPLKLNIIGVEKKFDFEIIKPWSRYSFNTSKGKLEGYLGIKGTVDLVTQHDASTLEIVDWKTGRRSDINTGQEKTIKSLELDPQLRLYHYAIHEIYPEIDNVFITIFYITDGGPYSIFFNKSDLPKTEEMIQERFQRIKDTVRPRLIYPNWKCTKLCHYGKNKYNNSDKTICQHFKDEVINLGIEKVTNKYADLNKITQYGSGGGVYTK